MDYMSLEPAQFETHFNPRATVRDIDARIARQAERSAEARARYPHVADIAYGPGPGERLDVFRPRHDGAPVLLFIHGGYWRALHKDGYSFIAPPFVDAGAAVVVMHYDLAPAVSLDDIVAETARSIVWTHAHIADYGGDPDSIYIAGNSAGGHLAAMMLARDFSADGLPEDVVKGATLVTGVMDCAPVLKTSVNADIGLDAPAAWRLSPIHHPPRRALPLIVAVGGAETPGWIALSKAYADVLDQAGIAHRYMEMPGLDHVGAGEAVGDPKSPLAQAMIAQMGLS